MNFTRLHTFFFVDKMLRWMIPNEHPGQNRALYYNATKTFADGKVTNNFYTDYYIHPIERVAYLIKVQHAIISHFGSVLFVI